MRCLVLALALTGCKDKPKQAEAPKAAPADAQPLRAPAKSSKLDAAKAQQLAKLDVDGWTKTVRLAGGNGLDVRFTRPPLAVTVQASPCFDCLPMDETKWRAKDGALRGLIAPELREHRDTTWELGMTEIGTPAAFTFHLGHTAAAAATAYTLYFNDGVNMIRVVAEYDGAAPPTREALATAAPKGTLEQTAKAFASRFVHAW
jgi:hypothetical protein